MTQDAKSYYMLIVPPTDEGFHDHAITFLFVAWAQSTDHDLTLTADIDEIVARARKIEGLKIIGKDNIRDNNKET